MNQDHPRISFAYPTFIRPGMIATGPFYPDIGWSVMSLPASMSFYVSVGLMLNSKRPYSFDIDVLFESKSLIPKNIPAIDTQLLHTKVSERDDFVALSTTLLTDVQIQSDGLYTVRVYLFTGEVGSTERDLIDQYDCHFVLAKNWIENQMTRNA